VLLAPLVLGIVLTAAAVGPVLHFAYANTSLHVAIETANGLIAVFAFLLVTGRLRRGVVLSDLALAVALALLALSNLLFSTIPAAANGDQPSVFAAWSPLLGRLVGGVALVVAAYAPAHVVARPRRTIALAVGATAALLMLVVGLVLIFEPSLPPALSDELTPERADHARIMGPPGVIVLQLAGALIYGLAAVGFARRFERVGDELLGWLAAAAVLLAFARLNRALFPALFPGWLYTADLLRLGSYVLVLAGAAREIARAQREGALAAVLEERQRMARDIHDGLAHELAFISTHAQRLGPRTVGRRDEQTALVVELGDAARRALEESRAAIGALTEPLDEPLDTAIARAAEEVSVRYGVRLRFALESPMSVPAPTRTAMSRIVREAVTNAARHGGVDEVQIELARDGRGLRLVVSDSGHGFDPASADRRGFGLRSMRERAQALGGTFEVRSAPDSGCVVEVRLP
jgi:signal transduction histidine kinase